MQKVNDHIVMVSYKGQKKAVPIWLIQDWIKANLFSLIAKSGNQVGWDFADHAAGVKDMQDYEKDMAERATRQHLHKASDGTLIDRIPAGLDGAAREAKERAILGLRLGGGQPPTPEPGEEEFAHSSDAPGPRQKPAQRPDPKDII